MKTNKAALVLFTIVLLTSSQGIAQSETVATAAKKAFDQGELERKLGNYSGAITLLRTAVRLAPESALYHHRLGKACLKAEKFDAMWVHIRRAAFLKHTNEEYANDFMKLWLFHDRQGSLNAGTPSDTVLEKIGEPDKRIEDGRMKRWIYAFMAVDFGQDKIFQVIDLRGYTPEAAAEPEQVKVQTAPKYWHVAHHSISRRDDSLELVPRGEVIQNWTELFSKQRFPLMSRTEATVRGMADTMRASLQRSGALVEFKVLSEAPKTITYHWRTSASEEHPAQHEIAKLIEGQKDFYRVAYVKKTHELSSQEFSKWSEVIDGATLIPRSPHSSVTAPAAESNKLNIELASWELGKNLAFAALLRGRHGPDEIVKETLLHVSRNSHLLDVSVPPPSPLDGDPSSDTAAAIQYLLETAGKPVHAKLQAKHGQESAALFELGTKTTLLSMLYEPESSASESFAIAIERSAQKAQLDPQVWQPLTTKLKSGAATADVRTEVKLLQKTLSSM